MILIWKKRIFLLCESTFFGHRSAPAYIDYLRVFWYYIFIGLSDRNAENGS